MRPSHDQFFMSIAREVATRGTCARRQVGVVLVDDHNFILSTGYNGPASGWPHCRDGVECPGARAPSGTNLDECVANHSEVSAILRCPDTSRIKTVYTTTSPCVSCTKMLLCTSALRVVFSELYSQAAAEELWTRHHLQERDRAGTLVRSWYRTWEQLQPDGSVKVIGSSEWRK